MVSERRRKKCRRRFAAKNVYLAFRRSKKYGKTYSPGESFPLSPEQHVYLAFRSSKKYRKHIVPESARHYLAFRRSKKYWKTYSAGESPLLFPWKYCYFWHFRLPTAAGPDGLSGSTKYTPDGLSESTKYTQNQWKINIFIV